MVSAAFRVLGAAVGDEGAEAWVGTPAELAAEGAVRVALVFAHSAIPCWLSD